MKGDWGQIHHEIGHILHYQRIDTGSIQLPDKASCLVELRVIEYGIHGHIYPRTVYVCKITQGGNVGHRVTGSGPRAESRGTDIYCIGPGEYGHAANLGITRRGKEFKTAMRHGVCGQVD